MTFPEAGIQILEKAGRPLHIQEIVQQAIAQGLLSHVGQIPEQTMRERLVALARRSSDRKLIVVGPGQFALTDWGLPEDAVALSELDETSEPVDEKPLRSKERHPPISKPMASSRGDGAREGGRNGKKKRRLPPLSVVAAEILGEVGARSDLETLLTRGRERGLMSDDLSRETLLNALNEENRRRGKAGRTPVFELVESQVTLLSADALEPLRGEEPEGRETLELPVAATGAASSAGALVLEAQRQAARQLRRKVQDLSNAGLERLALQLLAKSGYRDARPVKPTGVEHERLFVTRRRLGLTELRFLVQVLPLGREATREHVQALRSFLIEVEAHAAVIVGPADASREARAESQRFGQPLLTLLCGDAFLEELVLREVGVISYQATVVDDAFWKTFRRGADPKPEPREAGGRHRRGAEPSPSPLPMARTGPVPPVAEATDVTPAEPQLEAQADVQAQPGLPEATAPQAPILLVTLAEVPAAGAEPASPPATEG